jgi:hypothetical protein
LRTLFLPTSFLILMALAPTAFAYIGPGAGISVFSSLLGLLATILLAVAAILLWPIRRAWKKMRAGKELVGDEDGDFAAGLEQKPVETTVADKGNVT